MADADGDGEVDLHEFKTKLAATKMAATKTVAKPSAKDKAGPKETLTLTPTS